MKMDRREFLGRLTTLFGGALATPCVSFLATASAATQVASSKLFSPEQHELVATATELILPTTDTPGAREAGVADFIEMMLVDWYRTDERADFLRGLAKLDALATERVGKKFVDASEADQIEILTTLEKDGLAAMAAQGFNPMALLQERKPPPDFFLSLKQLTLVGYYTSKIGATQELVFNPIPGRFESCIPAGTHGRVWIGGF